jgi:hypothetical protein
VNKLCAPLSAIWNSKSPPMNLPNSSASTVSSRPPASIRLNLQCASSAIVIGQKLVAQLQDAKPVRRLLIDIHKIVAQGPSIRPTTAVRDGDKLMIPKKSQAVTTIFCNLAVAILAVRGI